MIKRIHRIWQAKTDTVRWGRVVGGSITGTGAVILSAAFFTEALAGAWLASIGLGAAWATSTYMSALRLASCNSGPSRLALKEAKIDDELRAITDREISALEVAQAPALVWASDWSVGASHWYATGGGWIYIDAWIFKGSVFSLNPPDKEPPRLTRKQRDELPRVKELPC
jgi:hypothetical protein